MAETDSANRNLLGNLARLGAGLIVVAAAAASALESRQQRQRVDRRGGARSLNELLRTRPPSRRRQGPPEAGIAAPAVPPRGPLPVQGGAAVRLDFEA